MNSYYNKQILCDSIPLFGKKGFKMCNQIYVMIKKNACDKKT